MEYYSKLDNKTFTSKEALIEHLVEHYSMTMEEGNHKDMITKIKDRVPLVEIISINKDNKGNLVIAVAYYNDNKEYLDGEEIIIGKITDFDYYEYNIFEDLESLISYISSYYKNAELIKSLLRKHDIDKDSFVVTGIHTGGHDSSPGVYFRFTKDGKIFDKKYSHSDTLKELENQIKSYFVKELEGVVENTWESCSNTQIFRVNGVDLDEFLTHGKIVKIEILD